MLGKKLVYGQLILITQHHTLGNSLSIINQCFRCIVLTSHPSGIQPISSVSWKEEGKFEG